MNATYHDIYRDIQRMPERSVSVELPPVPTVAIPPVPQPRCPEHCSGRCRVESLLTCPDHGPSYQLIAHEWFHMAGHWFYETKPVNGALAVLRRDQPKCRECGGHLRREEPRR